MTLRAMPAFAMITIIGLGVQVEARTPCQEYLRLRNAATEALACDNHKFDTSPNNRISKTTILQRMRAPIAPIMLDGALC